MGVSASCYAIAGEMFETVIVPWKVDHKSIKRPSSLPVTIINIQGG
ncbi:hypothetical protein E5S67_02552 [Microcoleus sp. IPMA8]|uniref:Uncharacterized protein n=1 Tax=Microcoleus asticus IPMA8 TaxID=2563858 RepID=A0ABX2CXD9_9CYAN|nr:hypothetical protein [Microcoleus asticus IPMA8]